MKHDLINDTNFKFKFFLLDYHFPQSSVNDIRNESVICANYCILVIDSVLQIMHWGHIKERNTSTSSWSH